MTKELDYSQGRLRGKRVLITGASGFIGSTLANAIAATEQPSVLVLLGRQTTPTAAQPKECSYYCVDLVDRESVIQFGRSHTFDVIFHLAGKIDQSVRPHIFEEQFKLHIEATLNILDAFADKSPSRFVQVGSNAEYGDALCPQTGQTQEQPNSAYGVSKLTASKMVLAKHKSEGLPALVARPYLVYGAGQSTRSFLSTALGAARSGSDFATTLGEQTRDFISIDKVCNDLIELGSSSHVRVGEVYNICTGVPVSIKEVLLMLQEAYPAFNPIFGAVPYRATELMSSFGEAFHPLPPQTAKDALRHFIRLQ